MSGFDADMHHTVDVEFADVTARAVCACGWTGPRRIGRTETAWQDGAEHRAEDAAGLL